MISYEVDGVALVNPSRWITPDAGGAFSAPTWRGGDLRIPGVVGETPLPRIRGVDFDEFVMRVSGLVNSLGSTASDPTAQFVSNLRALQSVLVPADGGTIEVTKTVTTASVDEVYGPATCRCVSDLSPKMEAPWTGLVLVRLKVYGGWA